MAAYLLAFRHLVLYNLPMDILNRAPNYLLTRDGNPKTVKGNKFGYLTAIMHLAPHKLSGANVCAHATDGCAAACLNTAGRGGINLDENGLNAIQIARIQRTRLFRRDRDEFMRLLQHEIDLHVKYARARGFVPVFRLNGTSDIPFENIRYGDYQNVFDANPDVQFYDYTKYPARLRNTEIPNYHLTFSLAETNRANAIDAIRNGLNVAAVLRVRRSGILPATLSFGGSFRKVVDGDATDLRFLDPAGAIVGLRAKGRARYDTSGFVLDTAV